uniref:Uncharacterized protein n=1 Tax=Oryza sativa subsp. japonica TaxID=39947 RepID=Q6ZHP3_ORYSJ|nr:hypothetical protein [Oryza sativa Japonica Group]
MADGAGRDRSGLGPGKRKERVRPESTEEEEWEREALPPVFGRMRAARLGHACWLAGQGAAQAAQRGRARGRTAQARAAGG